MGSQAMVALVIFLFTYALIISEKVHRTIIAMLGGLFMVVFGILDQQKAIHYIDFNTIGLLAGMMIIVSITAQTGVFEYVASWSAQKVKGDPIKILAVLSLLTALASAFLDNVTTVLLVVPVTLSITSQLKVPPIPFLLSEIFASNIGGTATMIGDPPNLMIGSAAKLSFLAFIDNLTFINVVILIVTHAHSYRHLSETINDNERIKAEAVSKRSPTRIKRSCLINKMSTRRGFNINWLFPSPIDPSGNGNDRTYRGVPPAAAGW